jgi:thioredoxin reductase (NADPH)
MSQYLVERVREAGNVEVLTGAQVEGVRGERCLEAVTVARNGTVSEIPATGLFIFIGAAPRTAMVAGLVERNDQGFILTGRDLMADGKRPRGWAAGRDPFLFETSVPGIFAAGDARQGSGKRVAAAVGEGSATVSMVHEYLQTV